MESLREEVRDFEIGIRKKRNEYAKKMENAKKEAGERSCSIAKSRRTVAGREGKERGGRGEGERKSFEKRRS